MIPAYLRHIARENRVKGNRTTFSLVCSCGNEWFDLFHNKLTKEEQAEYDRYYEADKEAFRGSYASMCTRDEDGKLHHWKFVFPGIKIEVFPPEMPSFATVVSWRARCSKCGAEYLIFDSRFHGYDGVFCGEGNNLDYVPWYVKRNTRDKAPRRIEITTENDETLAQFHENTGIDSDYDTYSNGFGWISINMVDNTGKKTKVLDHESA